ncbi:MAG: helix-turn-helix domain-containing protein, partial [Kordiimonas sp.]
LGVIAPQVQTTVAQTDALGTPIALDTDLGTNSLATLAELERKIIEDRIEAFDGSIPKAADSLGVSPSTIYRKKEDWVKKGLSQETSASSIAI